MSSHRLCGEERTRWCPAGAACARCAATWGLECRDDAVVAACCGRRRRHARWRVAVNAGVVGGPTCAQAGGESACGFRRSSQSLARQRLHSGRRLAEESGAGAAIAGASSPASAVAISGAVCAAKLPLPVVVAVDADDGMSLFMKMPHSPLPYQRLVPCWSPC